MASNIIGFHREYKLNLQRERRMFGPRRARPSICALRIPELSRLFRDRYGLYLPLDDAGFEDARIMADHMVQMAGDPRRRISQWLKLVMPSLSLQRGQAIIETAIHQPRRWRADTLAKAMQLTDTDRTRLRITTIGAIDVTKAERAIRRKIRRRQLAAETRAAKRTQTRAEYLAASISKAKPWEVEGISRRTWYRRRKTGTSPVAP